MIDVDLGSGAGVGAAVAAVAWLVIQQVIKPILSLWASYASWPESAKTALWSGVITIAAGTWAWIAFGDARDVLLAIAVALAAGSGINAASQTGQSDDKARPLGPG